MATQNERDKAAASRKAATDEQRQGTVRALIAERRGYVQRSMPKRVAEVDAQIKVYGGEKELREALDGEKADAAKTSSAEA